MHLLAVSGERAAGATEALKEETKVRTDAAARSAPTLAVRTLTEGILVVHAVTEQRLSLVKHVAWRAAASRAIVRGLLEARLANVDVPTVTDPLVFFFFFFFFSGFVVLVAVSATMMKTRGLTRREGEDFLVCVTAGVVAGGEEEGREKTRRGGATKKEGRTR